MLRRSRIPPHSQGELKHTHGRAPVFPAEKGTVSSTVKRDEGLSNASIAVASRRKISHRQSVPLLWQLHRPGTELTYSGVGVLSSPAPLHMPGL